MTKLGDLALGSLDVTGPTSSAPGLMTRVIEILDLRPGHRVLEIGTGTGYNAGLLSYLLGDERVISVGVDAELVDAARVRLDELGYRG